MISKEVAILEQIHPLTYGGENLDEAVIHRMMLCIWSHFQSEDRESAEYMARDLLERHGSKAVDCVSIRSWDDDWNLECNKAESVDYSVRVAFFSRPDSVMTGTLHRLVLP